MVPFSRQRTTVAPGHDRRSLDVRLRPVNRSDDEKGTIMTNHPAPAEAPQQIQPRRRRGRPFQPGTSGNPAGKPKGTRNRATLAAETLLDGEAEALTRKAIELALGGDSTALRLCIERIVAPRRDRAVNLDMPEMRSPEDAARAMSAIVSAVGAGDLTPGEAADVARLLDAFLKMVEAQEFEARLRAVEEQVGKR